MQLQDNIDRFHAAGINVIAITYDRPERQAPFLAEFDEFLPLLSDVETTTFRNLGILNQEYGPGEPGYGLPYPGTFVVDPQGTIVAKVFLTAYQQRLDVEVMVRQVRAVLEGTEPSIP